jgi:hypothetical protein
MNSFQAELNIKFDQQLENPHVISSKQVMISILSQGVKNNKFNFSFQNRENYGMFIDLGYSLISIAERTPGGILLFFPSYRLLEQCYETW